jgi:uracil-DNA glycosylase
MAGWDLFVDTYRDDIHRCLDTIGARCTKPGVRMIPQPSRVFRFMEMCPYERINVVIMGQDPYATLDKDGCTYANGIAFSVDSGMTPSLRVLREWLWQHDSRYRGWEIDTTLESWCQQGVLLMNASLTVECNDKGVAPMSHKIVWESVIRSLIGFCSRRPGTVFVLLGSTAADYEDSVTDGCCVIKAEHPASLARKGSVPLGSQPFTRINDELLRRGKAPIRWTSVFH